MNDTNTKPSIFTPPKFLLQVYNIILKIKMVLKYWEMMLRKYKDFYI